MAHKHVLVPTDFSETAEQAFNYARAEAAAEGAQLTLLHVLPPGTGTKVYYVTPASVPGAAFDPDASAHFGAPWPASPTTVVRADPAEAALTRLRDMIPCALRHLWQAEIAMGPIAETIVRVAREQAVDLIVMGTHGRTGLQHLLAGSVAEKVVRLAPCPVLTIRADGTLASGVTAAVAAPDRAGGGFDH